MALHSKDWRPTRPSTSAATTSDSSFNSSTSFPPSRRAENIQLVAELTAHDGEARTRRVLDDVGLKRAERPFPVAVVRRRTTACRHRQGTRQEPSDPVVRRANRRARLRDWQDDSGSPAPAEPGVSPDGAAGDPQCGDRANGRSCGPDALRGAIVGRPVHPVADRSRGALMVSPLNRKLVRDMRRHRAQFVAVAITIFLGVAVFAASYDSFQNLEASYSQTFVDYRFANLTVRGGEVDRTCRGRRRSRRRRARSCSFARVRTCRCPSTA